jgi:Outer membrane lipoprotein carrier protein LolA-like
MRGIGFIRCARRPARKGSCRGRRACVPDRCVAWLAGAALALTAMLYSAPSLAASSTLDQVMALLGKRKHGEVKYVEEDYFKILDEPVKSSGVLVYDAPDHLEKKTLAPKAQSLILDGERLTVRRGGRAYRLDLSAYPQLAPVVDSIRDTLAGNEQALKRVFKVSFTGTLEQWKLELVPLDEQVARKVRRVEILGSGAELRSVEIFQSDGDRSLMRIAGP